MAISVVQFTAAAESTTNNTTVAASVTNAPTPGNHLILFGTAAGNTPLTGVGDGVNRWKVRVDNQQSAAQVTQILLADCIVRESIAGGTITATFAGNVQPKLIYVFEVAGLSPVDWFGGNPAPGVNIFTGASRFCNPVSVRYADDLVLGLFASAGAGTESSLTPGAGFTNLPAATGSGYFNGANSWIEGVYRLAAAVGTTSPTATGGASPTAYGHVGAWYKAPRSNKPLPPSLPKPRPFKPGITRASGGAIS